MLGSPRIK